MVTSELEECEGVHFFAEFTLTKSYAPDSKSTKSRFSYVHFFESRTHAVSATTICNAFDAPT